MVTNCYTTHQYRDFLFRGTRAPAFRASDKPMAIACLRLVTFLLLLPERSCPRLYSCITFFTFFCDFVFGVLFCLGINCSEEQGIRILHVPGIT